MSETNPLEAPFASVVVATDFSEAADRALAVGLALARRGGRRLHLVHVIEPFEAGPLSPLRHAPEAKALGATPEETVGDLLADQAARHDLEGVEVEPVVLKRGPVAEKVLRYAASLDAPGPVVVGRNRHAGLLRRRRLGGTAEALVRHADRPLVVVPAPHGAEPPDPGEVRRVVLAEDFLPAAEAALPLARAWAHALDADLVLAFVAERRAVPVFYDTGLFSFVTLEPDPEAVERAPDALAQLYDRSGGPEVAVRYAVREADDVARALEETARDEGAGLLLLGADRLDDADDGWFGAGGVTEKVLRRAEIPVALVPLTSGPDA